MLLWKILPCPSSETGSAEGLRRAFQHHNALIADRRHGQTTLIRAVAAQPEDATCPPETCPLRERCPRQRGGLAGFGQSPDSSNSVKGQTGQRMWIRAVSSIVFLTESAGCPGIGQGEPTALHTRQA